MLGQQCRTLWQAPSADGIPRPRGRPRAADPPSRSPGRTGCGPSRPCRSPPTSAGRRVDLPWLLADGVLAANVSARPVMVTLGISGASRRGTRLALPRRCRGGEQHGMVVAPTAPQISLGRPVSRACQADSPADRTRPHPLTGGMDGSARRPARVELDAAAGDRAPA